MKFKRILTLSMAMVMTVSTLVACGSINSGKESSAASSKTSAQSSSEEVKKVYTFPLAEPVTYSCYALTTSEEYPLKDNETWKYLIEECANFNIELTEIPAAECKEKFNLAMAGGNYPDFFYKCASLNVQTYGEDGLIIPLEDLIKEYMPNLTALLDERNAWDAIKAPDGHIYALPTITPQYTFNGNGVFWLNKTWVEKLNLKWPTNMEELYDVLKAFKEQDPNGNGKADEIPLILRGGGNLNQLIYLTGYQKMINTNTYYTDDGKIGHFQVSDDYKEYLAWLAKAYSEGLIYKDVLTTTTASMAALGVEGNYFGMYHETKVAGVVPVENEADYKDLACFVVENATRSIGVEKNALAITDKCENVEILLSYWDYWYSEEGGTTARIGQEGKTWVRNADGTYTPTLENYAHTAQWSLTGTAGVPFYVPDWIFTGVANDSSTNALAQRGALSEGGAWQVGTTIPVLTYTDEESERLGVLNTDLNGYSNTYAAEVMTGLKDLDATWDEYVSTLKKMGYEEKIQIQQAAYDRRSE